MREKNIFFTKAKISDLNLIGITAIILGIFYNFRTIESELEMCLTNLSFLGFEIFLLEIIAVILVSALTFILLSFNKTLLKVVLILALFISTLYLYIINKFGTVLDGAMIANALDSTGHVDEVIDYSALFYFLSWLLPTLFLIFKVEVTPVNVRKKICLSVTSVLVLLFLHFAFAADKLLKTSFVQYSPVNYVTSIYEYFDRFHSQLKQGENRHSLSELYKFERKKAPDNINVILVIGESLRYDHLGLNGYKRDTTPRLSKLDNFLNFTIRSSFNTTTRSVTSMLSHRTLADFTEIPPEKSAVSVFKELGFKTYWYSAQSSKEFHNGMINIMAAEADDYFFRDRLQASNHSYKVYDEALIPHLNNVLQQDGNNFVVLHSFGNHIRFYERYPENFKIFMPECKTLPSSCSKNEMINSYDNSILYTDYFVSQVIDAVKNSKAIVFFVADHGVFLGEHGIYANGGKRDANIDVVRKIPMFFYMSDKLQNDKFFRQKFSNAAKKTAQKNLSHDNVFDSLFDCSGVASDLFERDLSICR